MECWLLVGEGMSWPWVCRTCAEWNHHTCNDPSNNTPWSTQPSWRLCCKRCSVNVNLNVALTNKILVREEKVKSVAWKMCPSCLLKFSQTTAATGWEGLWEGWRLGWVRVVFLFHIRPATHTPIILFNSMRNHTYSKMKWKESGSRYGSVRLCAGSACNNQYNNICRWIMTGGRTCNWPNLWQGKLNR